MLAVHPRIDFYLVDRGRDADRSLIVFGGRSGVVCEGVREVYGGRRAEKQIKKWKR